MNVQCGHALVVIGIIQTLVSTAAGQSPGDSWTLNATLRQQRLQQLEQELMPLVEEASYWTLQQRATALADFKAQLAGMAGTERTSVIEQSRRADWQMMGRVMKDLVDLTATYEDDVRGERASEVLRSWETLADQYAGQVREGRFLRDTRVWVNEHGDVVFQDPSGLGVSPFLTSNSRRWEEKRYSDIMRRRTADSPDRITLELALREGPVLDRGAWLRRLTSMHKSAVAHIGSMRVSDRPSAVQDPVYRATRSDALALIDQLDRAAEAEMRADAGAWLRGRGMEDRVRIAAASGPGSLGALLNEFRAEAEHLRRVPDSQEELAQARAALIESLKIDDLLRSEAQYGNGRTIRVTGFEAQRPASVRRRGVREVGPVSSVGAMPRRVLARLDSGCEIALEPVVSSIDLDVLNLETLRLGDKVDVGVPRVGTRVDSIEGGGVRDLDSRWAIPVPDRGGLRASLIHDPYAPGQVVEGDFLPCMVVRDIGGFSVGFVVASVGPFCGEEHLVDAVIALMRE